MSTYMTGGAGSQAEMLTYNIDNGFPEAILRGLRKGLLNTMQYETLKLCANPIEFRLALEDTDYGYASENGWDIFKGQAEGKIEAIPLRKAMLTKLYNEI